MSDLLKRAMEQASDYDFDNVRPGVCKRCCHTHAPEWPCVLEGLHRHVAYRLDKERSLTARLAEAERERDEYYRLWKEACRVKDVRRVTAKGGRE